MDVLCWLHLPSIYLLYCGTVIWHDFSMADIGWLARITNKIYQWPVNHRQWSYARWEMANPHCFWLVVDLPLWKIWLISWDDYSQYMEKLKMFQSTNQVCLLSPFLCRVVSPMILIVAAKISFLAGQICHVGKILVKSYVSQVKSQHFCW